jgi:hypothetical protein
MNRRAIERRSIASFFLRPPQERRQVGVSLNNGYNYFSENNLNLNKVELKRVFKNGHNRLEGCALSPPRRRTRPGADGAAPSNETTLKTPPTRVFALFN